MRILFSIIISLILFGCSGREKPTTYDSISGSTKRETKPDWQSILDSAAVKGSILLYDAQKMSYYSNDFDWAEKGQLPASTFKIANSIIALETGVVESDSTIFKWDGQSRAIVDWEQDLTFREAFHFSCVPCYQEIAREIGFSQMRAYLDRIQYPGIQVDSSNIDIFWLQGNSAISQFQQIEFLIKLHQSQLSISPRTETIIKRMMLMPDGNYDELRGKTGWSIRDGRNNGWFLGYLVKEKHPYFFATNIAPTESFDMGTFRGIGKEITHQVLKELNLTK